MHGWYWQFDFQLGLCFFGYFQSMTSSLPKSGTKIGISNSLQQTARRFPKQPDADHWPFSSSRRPPHPTNTTAHAAQSSLQRDHAGWKVCPAPTSSGALQAKASTAGRKQCARIQQQPVAGCTEPRPHSARKHILGSSYFKTGNQNLSSDSNGARSTLKLVKDMQVPAEEPREERESADVWLRREQWTSSSPAACGRSHT